MSEFVFLFRASEPRAASGDGDAGECAAEHASVACMDARARSQGAPEGSRGSRSTSPARSCAEKARS